MYRFNKPGFTLAEVLITLLIIGVIAALVIPALINTTNKAEIVTKLKKEHAVLSQAFNLLAIDASGSIINDSNFNCSGSNCITTASANAMNEFAAKLNVVKNCGNSTGCWYNSPRKYLDGTVMNSTLDADYGSNYGKAILADGTMIIVITTNSNCALTPTGTVPAGSPLYQAVCGEIGVDINGATGPNQLGRDFFIFWMTKTGIYPKGTFSDGNSCNTSANTAEGSVGCTAKVLSEGAMNY